MMIDSQAKQVQETICLKEIKQKIRKKNFKLAIRMLQQKKYSPSRISHATGLSLQEIKDL